MRISKVIVCLGLVAGAAFSQSQRDSEAPKSYWGIEGGGSYDFEPQALIREVQSLANKEAQSICQQQQTTCPSGLRYSASLTGTAYNTGLVRFHPSGAMNFSVDFIYFSLNGAATDHQTLNTYSGSTAMPGVTITKYSNWIVRRRFSLGGSIGGGIGPQFKANYQENNGTTGATTAKTFVLNQLPVTPLLQSRIFLDVRVQRHLSVGAYAGMDTILPAIGGTVRIRFPR